MLARRLIPALLAAAAVAAPLAAHARPWTLNDGATTKFIDDVRISPDGTRALIDVATADAKTNTFAETASLVTLSDGSDGADAGRLALAAMVARRIDDRLAAHEEKRRRRDRDHRRARRIASRADGGGSLRTRLHMVSRRPPYRCRRNGARHGVERLARPLDDGGERLPQHHTAPT